MTTAIRCLLSLFLLFAVIEPAFSGIAEKLEAEKEFKKADAKLSTVYKELLAHVSDKRIRSDVIEAQKAWIAFRDKDALAMAGITSNGGSAFSLDYLNNLIDLTEERVSQLERIASTLK